MPQGIDRFTFEFADLKGKAYYSAFGKVTRDFLHAFSDNKHYNVILSAFLQQLFTSTRNISPENYKLLENSLVDRVNAILADERAHDKERVLKGRRPVFELQEEEEEEYEEEPELTEEELRRQEEERWERERQEEERRAAREEERRRNEEALRARARQVDAKAMEKLLQGATLLNPGGIKPKGGGGKQQQQQTTAEDLREMESQVAHAMKEKERLQTLLHTSEAELPARLEEAKKELEALRANANAQGGTSGDAAKSAASMQPKQMNARLAELKQKLSKQTTERNRLALQLKAQPHPLHEEILAVMQERDEIQLKLNSA